VQGTPADAFVEILDAKDITALKWVDDFEFFRYPTSSVSLPDGSVSYTYAFDLGTIIAISTHLGIVWNDLVDKGHDFGFTTEYTGFVFDLPSKRVYLSERKRLKILNKVTSFLAVAASGKIKCPAIRSLHGSLQHITFVYRDGRSFLPSLTAQISKFPNDFVSHNLSAAARGDLVWWQDILSLPNVSRSLLIRTTVDLDVWVDASTDFGIGILIGGRWAAWKLRPGWKAEGRDIGWAESIAIELACMVLCERDLLVADIIIHADNTSVIDAYKKGRSRNASRNSSIRRITEMLIPRNLSISPRYVPSELTRRALQG
jgi:hypothetical protein